MFTHNNVKGVAITTTNEVSLISLSPVYDTGRPWQVEVQTQSQAKMMISYSDCCALENFFLGLDIEVHLLHNYYKKEI